MEIIKIHEYKYFIQDDKLYEILLHNGKIIRCSCENFLKNRDCQHIEVLRAYMGNTTKISKVKDPYSWLKNYEKQFEEKLFGRKDNNNSK